MSKQYEDTVCLNIEHYKKKNLNIVVFRLYAACMWPLGTAVFDIKFFFLFTKIL